MNQMVGKITLLVCCLVLALAISACRAPSTDPSPTLTFTPTATPGAEAKLGTDEVDGVSGNASVLEMATRVADVATAVAQRTPIPSPTPGVIDRVVVDIVEQSGLAETTFLGLTSEDWLDLIVSILLSGLFLLVLVPAIIRVLTWLVQRTQTRYDDELLEVISRQLFWLVAVIIAQFAILRLDFLSDWFSDLVQDVAYLLSMGLLTTIVLRLIDFAATWLLAYLAHERRPSKRLRPLIISLKWLLNLFVLLIALTLVAAHFGFNISLLAPSLLFLLLIIGILGAAAQSMLTDSISGILILTDEPFRIGDIIYLPQLDTSGQVTSIGLRSTRIRTGDNRRIIVPNSEIGESEVINFSHPDPRHRMQIDFVAVGASFDELQQIIKQTVRRVDGVLQDKPIDVIYLSFGGTGREVRVRWWIESVGSQFRVQTKVLVALERALVEAGIDTPNLTYDLQLNQTMSSRNASEEIRISSQDK